MIEINPLVRDMRSTALAMVGMIARATEVTTSPHIDHALASDCWDKIQVMASVFTGMSMQMNYAEMQASNNHLDLLTERKSLMDQDYARVKQIFDDLPSRYSNQTAQYPDNVDPYCVHCHTKMSLDQIDKATEYGEWEGKTRMRCERCQRNYQEDIRIDREDLINRFKEVAQDAGIEQAEADVLMSKLWPANR